MGNLVSNSLFVPAAVLAILAFIVPRLLGRVLPEGVKPLFLNAFLSTIMLFVMSAAFFLCLYLWKGLSMAQVMEPGLSANIVHFGQLGLLSGIIWAPIMILSVAGLPRKWVHETW